MLDSCNDNFIDVHAGFLQFVQKEVTDGHLQQVDVCTRRVTNLLGPWKNVAQSTQNNKVSDACSLS